MPLSSGRGPGRENGERERERERESERERERERERESERGETAPRSSGSPARNPRGAASARSRRPRLGSLRSRHGRCGAVRSNRDARPRPAVFAASLPRDCGARAGRSGPGWWPRPPLRGFKLRPHTPRHGAGPRAARGEWPRRGRGPRPGGNARGGRSGTSTATRGSSHRWKPFPSPLPPFPTDCLESRKYHVQSCRRCPPPPFPHTHAAAAATSSLQYPHLAGIAPVCLRLFSARICSRGPHGSDSHSRRTLPPHHPPPPHPTPTPTSTPSLPPPDPTPPSSLISG